MNLENNTQIKKNIIIILLTILLTNTYTVNAALFEERTICIPEWYCTAYSDETCGTRICVDVNACELDIDKPETFKECINSENVLPKGYFTTDAEIIKLNVESGKVTQKIIVINSSAPNQYTLEIIYPSSYTKGTDFFTTSKSDKYIESKGDFNIIIDARNIIVGTYVVPVKISNAEYVKTIIIVVDVVPEDNPKIELNLDSNVKTIGKDTEILTELKIKGIDMVIGDTLVYTIMDPLGNIIVEQEKIIEDLSKIVERIILPIDMTEGYYTLSVKINDNPKTYTKSKTFSMFPPEKYSLVSEEARKNTLITIILIIVVILVVITLLAIINKKWIYKSYKAHRFSRRYRYTGRGLALFHFSMGRPVIKINLGIGAKLKKITDALTPKQQNIDYDRKLELLKKSYERGFISLKEYHNLLKENGFSVESNRVGKYYDELKNKEKFEAELKQQREKEEKEIERITVEQKRAVEKAEATVLQQERELEKELAQKMEREKEQEKELQREILEQKRLTDELARKEGLMEKELEAEKENNKHLEQNITHANVIVPVEKPLTIVAQLAPKENILDKRVNDNQSFVLSNNEKLHSLRELLNALSHMPEYVLDHHTRQGRNDFANWIGDIFQYYDIAEEVRKANNREEFIKILEQYR